MEMESGPFKSNLRDNMDVGRNPKNIRDFGHFSKESLMFPSRNCN